MRVVVIGATGVVGSAVANALANRGHEVLRASRQGPISVNIADAASIAAMYEVVGQVDAVVCCAGTGAFKPLTDTTDEDIAVTLQNKVVGPMNLVRSGVSHMRDGGVFVLTVVSKILLCHDADPDLFLLPPGVTRVIGDTRRRV